jgi:hypothetical protein
MEAVIFYCFVVFCISIVSDGYTPHFIPCRHLHKSIGQSLLSIIGFMKINYVAIINEVVFFKCFDEFGPDGASEFFGY